jgi:hypothetical protein
MGLWTQQPVSSGTAAVASAPWPAFSPDGKTDCGLRDNRLVLIEVATGAGTPGGACRSTQPNWRIRRTGSGWRWTTGGTIHLLELATGECAPARGAPQRRLLPGLLGGRPAAGIGRSDTTVLTWDVANLAGEPLAAANLSPKELEALWTDLAGDDAPRAYRAIWALAPPPNRACPSCGDSCGGPARSKHLARLIADLDADEFAVRGGHTRTREAGLVGPAGSAAARPAGLREVASERKALAKRAGDPAAPANCGPGGQWRCWSTPALRGANRAGGLTREPRSTANRGGKSALERLSGRRRRTGKQ